MILHQLDQTVRELRKMLSASNIRESERLAHELIDDASREIGKNRQFEWLQPVLGTFTVVKFSESIKTCMVSLTTGRISFNPEFFIKWIHCFNDLLFMVMHERGHLLLHRLIRIQPNSGFEEDVIINIMVSPQIGYDFTRRYYRDQLSGLDCRTPGLEQLLLQGDVEYTRKTLFNDEWSLYRVGPWEVVFEQYSNGYSGKPIQSIQSMISSIKQWRAVIPKQHNCDPKPNLIRPVESEESTPEGATDATDDVDDIGPPSDDQLVNWFISFASLRIPNNIGMSSWEGNLLHVPALGLTPTLPDNHSLAVVTQQSVGGHFSDVFLGTSIPSGAISSHDLTAVALDRDLSYWEHATGHEQITFDLYIDFSASMKEYWGALITLVRYLRGNVNRLYAFGTRVAPFTLKDSGVGVGIGTNSLSLLRHIETNPGSSLIVIATDLDFYPRLESTGISSRITALLSRRVNRIVIIHPVLEQATSASNLRMKYFPEVPTALQRRIQFVSMNSDGMATI